MGRAGVCILTLLLQHLADHLLHRLRRFGEHDALIRHVEVGLQQIEVAPEPAGEDRTAHR